MLRDNDDDKQCLPVARTGHFKIDLQRGAVCKTPLSQGFEHWGENWPYLKTPLSGTVRGCGVGGAGSTKNPKPHYSFVKVTEQYFPLRV